MFPFRYAEKSINHIEDYLKVTGQGLAAFREGVANYLAGNAERFAENLDKLSVLESEADSIRRNIENILYTRSLMPQLRGDIMQLIEELDKILGLAKSSLYQFDVEVPFIPTQLHTDINQLTNVSVSACEKLLPAVQAFFHEPHRVKEQLQPVYLLEKEADKMADSIKRKVFQHMPELKLSEKFHLRYFTLHIETLSDAAERVADLLIVMALKRII